MEVNADQDQMVLREFYPELGGGFTKTSPFIAG
jgi:hypothetical protein